MLSETYFFQTQWHQFENLLAITIVTFLKIKKKLYFLIHFLSIKILSRYNNSMILFKIKDFYVLIFIYMHIAKYMIFNSCYHLIS